VSDELAEIDALSLSLLNVRHLGTPLDPGGGIGAEDGVRFLVPSDSPPNAPRAWVGDARSLDAVHSNGLVANVETCGDAEAPVGRPCQAQDAWSFSVGSLACGANGPVCVGSRASDPASVVLDGVDAWTTGAGLLVTASAARRVREYDVAMEPFVVRREFDAPEAVTALYRGEDGMAIGLARSVLWMPNGVSVSQALRAETCGEIVRLLAAPGVLIADTTLGLEYFAASPNGLRRVKAQLGMQGIEANPPTLQEMSADRLPLGICRSLDRLLSPVLRRLASHRSIDVDELGTVWVAQNSFVAALDPRGDLSSRLLAVRRFPGTRLVGRAVGESFAIVDERSGRPELLQWAARPSLTAASRVQGVVIGVGEHRARSFVVERPRRLGVYTVRANGRQLQFARTAE
jgi:hypothetical protein